MTVFEQVSLFCRPSATADSASLPVAGSAGSALAGVAVVLAARVVPDVGGRVEPVSILL
jgi:hypothetical protein